APAAPANDLCANAITIGAGVFNFTTASANTDGPVGGTCEQATNHDVWYNFTVPCTGTVTIDTDGSYPCTDTVLSLYSGFSCPPGALVTCDDDGGYGFLSKITF